MGPIGAVVGIFVGHLFDKGLKRNWMHIPFAQDPQQRAQAQKAFFVATFSVMGHLAKCDGRVTKKEIHAAEMIMTRMSLNAEQRRAAINLFNQGKQASFDIDATLQNLRTACHGDKWLLQMFVNLQLQAAHADGALTANERELLQYIAQKLGFAAFDYGRFEDYYRAEGAYRQQQGRGAPRRDPRAQLKAAYVILGISETASDAEVKRAYRRLMNKHHPDKLVAKGLPDEMIKLANEKTQEIREAYEQIKQARGIS